MSETVIGRRVATIDDLEQPGDYCRTTVVANGVDEQTMFFVMPNAPAGSRFGWTARVCFPPHVERECEDGSLEVRESILVTGHGMLDANGDRIEAPGWHGYLDEGHRWRECA